MYANKHDRVIFQLRVSIFNLHVLYAYTWDIKMITKCVISLFHDDRSHTVFGTHFIFTSGGRIVELVRFFSPNAY